MECSEASAAEEPEHERLTQYTQQIHEQLQQCKEMHQLGMMSNACFQAVSQGLTRELEAKEKQLADTAKAITMGKDSLRRYKKALMYVLKSVAEGCSRKRPRME